MTTGTGTDHCSVVLAKGRRDRPAEEDLVALAIVLWLARACGVAAASPRSLLHADERYAEAVVQAGDLLDQLLAGGLARVTAWPDGQLVPLGAPAAVRPVLHAIPESRFRLDSSFSGIRSRRRAAP